MAIISNIVFVGLILSGIGLLAVYTYIALWRIPKEKETREKLSWYVMICGSAATFCFLLAWRVREPLAKDFLPIFFILSLVIGYLLRESAISPYKLAEFWSKFGSGRKQKEKKEDKDTTNHRE